MNASNWKSTVCCCLAIASKLFEDYNTKNDYFATKFGCDVRHINAMELTSLHTLEFNVGVERDDYIGICKMTTSADNENVISDREWSTKKISLTPVKKNSKYLSLDGIKRRFHR